MNSLATLTAGFSTGANIRWDPLIFEFVAVFLIYLNIALEFDNQNRTLIYTEKWGRNTCW